MRLKGGRERLETCVAGSTTVAGAGGRHRAKIDRGFGKGLWQRRFPRFRAQSDVGQIHRFRNTANAQFNQWM